MLDNMDRHFCFLQDAFLPLEASHLYAVGPKTVVAYLKR